MAEPARQVEAAHAGTERDIEAEYRTEVAELLAKMQPTFSLWRERGDNERSWLVLSQFIMAGKAFAIPCRSRAAWAIRQWSGSITTETARQG